MSFHSDVNELAAVLRCVVRALERFDGPAANYTASLAIRLEPLVASFQHAVLQSRSREAAAAVLDDIKPLMAEVSSAATKGEMDIVPGDTLDRYHQLATLFQESRYAGHNL